MASPNPGFTCRVFFFFFFFFFFYHKWGLDAREMAAEFWERFEECEVDRRVTTRSSWWTS
jgi:hypothetical protein